MEMWNPTLCYDSGSIMMLTTSLTAECAAALVENVA